MTPYFCNPNSTMRLLFLLGSFLVICTCGPALLLGQSVDDRPQVSLASRQLEDRIEIVATNGEYVPCSVVVNFELANMAVRETGGPDTITLAPRSDTVIYTLVPVKSGQRYGFGYESHYAHGTVRPRPYDTNYVYELPFAAGETYRVDQGYDGQFSHAGESVLDFSMPEGTAIFAARGGTVARVVDRWSEHCPKPECKRYNNVIEIVHDDGTMADYVHLQTNSARVGVGQRVAAGDLIGRSGRTGYTTGPHLHFGVYRQGWERREHLRTRFRVAGAAGPVELVEGQSYLRPYEAH